MLLLATQVAGIFLEGKMVDAQLLYNLQQLLGPESAQTVVTLLGATRIPSQGGIWTTIIGVVVLLFASTRAFFHLRTLLDDIWDVRPRAPPPLLVQVKDRLVAFAAVLVVGALLMVSSIASWIFSAVSRRIDDVVEIPRALFRLTDWLFAPAVLVIGITLLFRVLPSRQPAWRDALIGAALTTVLFTVGKVLFGLYLRTQDFDSTYGAAGSLVALLVWFYFSAHALLLGAELTGVLYRYRKSGDPSAPRVSPPRSLRDAHPESIPVPPPGAGDAGR